MKRALLIACSLLAVAPRARADERPVLRVVFVAPSSPHVVEAAACTLSGIRVGGRVLDVRYEGRHCGADVRSEDALAIRGRVDGSNVVLEADADAEDAERVNAVLHAAADVLNQRITDANATVSAVARRSQRVPWSPELQQLGIGLVVVGCLAAATSAVMFSIGNPDAHLFQTRDSTFDLASAVTLAVGAGLVVLGGPLWVVGSHTVVRVTAAASPAGGSLRIVF